VCVCVCVYVYESVFCPSENCIVTNCLGQSVQLFHSHTYALSSFTETCVAFHFTYL